MYLQLRHSLATSASHTGTIAPSLSHFSLISVSKFCNAGYTVAFNKDSCPLYNSNLLVFGHCQSILPQHPHNTHLLRVCTHLFLTHTMHTIVIPFNTHKKGQNMHQVFFCPPIQTLAHLGFLKNTPFFDANTIKDLTKSPATAKS